MNVTDLRTIKKALILLVPTNKIQAKAASEAMKIVFRELRKIKEDV